MVNNTDNIVTTDPTDLTDSTIPTIPTIPTTPAKPKKSTKTTKPAKSPKPKPTKTTKPNKQAEESCVTEVRRGRKSKKTSLPQHIGEDVTAETSFGEWLEADGAGKALLSSDQHIPLNQEKTAPGANVHLLDQNTEPPPPLSAKGKAVRTNGSGKSKAVYNIHKQLPAQDPSEDETVIIKLDVQATQLDPMREDDMLIKTHETEGPLAYNGYGMLFGGAYPSLDGGDITPCMTEPASPALHLQGAPSTTLETQQQQNIKSIRLLMDFDEKCKNGEWPASTSVHCYWCCHRFSNVPVGIPLSYNEELAKFMVYGCFCSCECAAAYNLESKESADELMMRHSLINMLARELGYQKVVRPAPSRLILTMFGGPMTIDEFREVCHTSRLVLVNFPPMMTITQQVEEISQKDLRSEYRYIPIDHDRVNKYKEKIKLKRTKPLVNYRNTLDHAMNLKFT